MKGDRCLLSILVQNHDAGFAAGLYSFGQSNHVVRIKSLSSEDVRFGRKIFSCRQFDPSQQTRIGPSSGTRGELACDQILRCSLA
jgi:hypothetical protein